ncbi:MAG: VCBS repeat-containing protein, partial [Lentisphaeria bacterium]|nr:VCBS repeat-containing protein [Lentisphaeria bacterium]
SDASRYWMRCADAVFDGQASTFQILEDAAGYLGYAPASTVNYALARGNLRYLDRGVALHHAISVARTCINNLGLSTGFGDSSNLVQPSFFEQLAPVAWYHRDPQLYWIIRNMLPQACGLRIFQNSIAFDLSVEPVRPDQWTGMSVLPIYEAPLAKGDAREKPVYADRTIVDSALFNKIVFRENWDEDGQYMLLDGAGVWGGPPGPHGHKQNDINTVINLTAHGRMWLVDHTYQYRSYADHSGVMLMREGRGGYRKRTLARIRSLGENAKWGISGTSFMDNTRAIFWRKGKYFLVVDRCVAPTDGEYMARCSWRTLGEPTQEETGLLLEQQDRFFRIVSDGRASLDVEAVRLTSDHWSRFYPFAEPVVQVLQEDRRALLRAGEALGFANLLIPGATQEETKRVELRSPRESVVVVRDGAATVVAGTGVVPGTDLAGGMFLFAPSTAFMGECTDAFGGAVLSDGPCDVMLDLGSGELRVRCVEGRVITLRGDVETVLVDGKQVALERRVDGGVSVALAAGTSLVQPRGWSGLRPAAEFANAMRERIAKLPSDTKAETASGVSADGSGNPEIGVEEIDLALPVAAALVVDMDGDGTREWVAGGADGAGIFRADGTVVARFARGVEILSLDVGDVDGDGVPEIVAGTKGCKVRLYRADGSPLWEFACKPSKGSTDGTPVVEMVRIADLDGDGSREIVAGANWVHVINADGSLRWERYMDLRRGRICGDFVCGDVTDLDGDGTREIVALFNTSYPLLKAYDHRGEVVLPAGKTPHGGVNISSPRGVTVCAVPGGVTKQIVCGTSRDVRVIRHNESSASGMLANISGAVVALASCTEDGTVLLAVADPFCGVRLGELEPSKDARRIKWRQRWYHSLEGKISVVEFVRDSSGRLRVAVGTKNGGVTVFHAQTGDAVCRVPTRSGAVVRIFEESSGGITVLSR